MVAEYDFDEAPPVSRISMRDYQVEGMEKVQKAWTEFSRVLFVMATGTGKTEVFAKIAAEEVAQNRKVLILAHTDELLEQAIFKLKRSTGLQAAKEKADEMASPFAMVVVASIQSISRVNRLRGFKPDHFGLVIVDECHRILAASYQRVCNYFHFGAQSLEKGWEAPVPGVPYQPLARVLGVTATADRGDKRTLGEFFQTCAFEYGLLEAVRDGYLVRPIVKNIPPDKAKLDLRGAKVSKGDFEAGEIARRLAPFLVAIAPQLAAEVQDRKTVCFLPSIETARLMSEELAKFGLRSSFVSGQCPDREAKIAAFHATGIGSVICNAMLLTEGWDCPDASAICVLRPTKIRSLYAQCVGRATRPLPGIIDGLLTREERLAAIAASAKRDTLIIDFIWAADNLDLIKPVDLVASGPEVRAQMLKDGVCDLVDGEAKASRDLLKALEEAARKARRRKARTIDPLAWAVSLGDAALAGWEPSNAWDELPATPKQLSRLQNNGIDVTNVTCRGLASKIIDRLMTRMRMRLCTPKQLSLMARLGLDEQTCALLTVEQATKTIDEALKAKRQAPAEELAF